MSDHDHPQLAPAGTPSIELDPERQRTAKEYAGIKRRLFFFDLGVAILLVLALLTAPGLQAALNGLIPFPQLPEGTLREPA